MANGAHAHWASNLTHRPEPLHRTISEALRQAREREEQENLLGDEEAAIADNEGCLRLTESFTQTPFSDLPVYRNIHRIRRLILASIDDPYTLEQLRGPRINVALVRPLVNRLYDPNDISVVFCLLVNKQEFLRDQHYESHHQTVNLTRATLCELVAARVLRKHSEDNPGREGLLLLANILVGGFEPFQNAPEDVLHHSARSQQWFIQDRRGHEKKLAALEIAIISESKLFLSSSACRKVVDAVYSGRVVYTPTSFIDLIPDHYKRKNVSLYSPNKASLLNQYRLIVPRTRNILEVGHFIVLLILYTVTMVHREGPRLTSWECVFLVYAAGWVLDEFASTLEHGWQVHTQNLWSFLDIGFVFIYWIYFAMRMIGIARDDDELGRQALDVLACAAPIIFPRIAFNLMSENVLFLSLRVMLKQFAALTALAIWCFAGFLLAMRWLSRWHPDSELHEPAHEPTTIGKWMIWIWFGLDGTGIQRSTDFHMILGPILMITFAFLGNTLFLTILVSMLSNTFSKLVSDATAEIQFRRAVLTFEGVKSDAIFAYRPPFNVLALIILVPLKFVVSERWFHKVHITAARIQNLPILLAINMWERKRLWKKVETVPGAPIKRMKGRAGGLWAQLSVHADIKAVFDAEPPEAMIKEIDEEDCVDDDVLDVGISRNRSISPGSADHVRRRRLSSINPRDLVS